MYLCSNGPFGNEGPINEVKALQQSRGGFGNAVYPYLDLGAGCNQVLKYQRVDLLPTRLPIPSLRTRVDGQSSALGRFQS